ncbi:hypothetical protein ABZ990_02640 [Streptomyces sp. NPDC046203]
MRRELSGLERVMKPWQDAPVGQELAEVLASVTEGYGGILTWQTLCL